MKIHRILLSITSYNYNYYINQDEIAIFGKIIIKFPTFIEDGIENICLSTIFGRR